MEKFLQMYKDLNRENLHLLEGVYSSDIRFIDPAHEIVGIVQLTEYFSALYQNVETITFDFHDIVQQDKNCYLQWNMTFSHKRFARGKSIIVSGTTFLQLDDQEKVHYHRDYFDIGAMLYEHIPILGSLIGRIKRRLGT